MTATAWTLAGVAAVSLVLSAISLVVARATALNGRRNEEIAKRAVAIAYSRARMDVFDLTIGIRRAVAVEIVTGIPPRDQTGEETA